MCIRDRRTTVQEHAANMGESATAFINRAIDETMSRDNLPDKEEEVGNRLESYN